MESVGFFFLLQGAVSQILKQWKNARSAEGRKKKRDSFALKNQRCNAMQQDLKQLQVNYFIRVQNLFGLFVGDTDFI